MTGQNCLQPGCFGKGRFNGFGNPLICGAGCADSDQCVHQQSGLFKHRGSGRFGMGGVWREKNSAQGPGGKKKGGGCRCAL